MGIRDQWLTTAEYAATAQVTQQTVRRWAAEGRLDSRRVGRRLDVREHRKSAEIEAAAAAEHAREILDIISGRDDLADLATAAEELAAELERRT